MYVVRDWDDQRLNVGKRKKQAHGIIIHGTGSGGVVRGLDNGIDPNDAICEYYDNPDSHAPHAVCTWKEAEGINDIELLSDADIYVISPDEYRTWHAGLAKKWKRIYGGDRNWRCWVKVKRVVEEMDEPDDRYDSWDARWPQADSPLDIIPKGDPNQLYLGIEIVVPVELKRKGGYRRVPYTRRQHDVVAWWFVQNMYEHGWPQDEVKERSLGHGDEHPIARYAGWGEYDPGSPRYWDWDLYYECVAEHIAGNTPTEPYEGPGQHP